MLFFKDWELLGENLILSVKTVFKADKHNIIRTPACCYLPSRRNLRQIFLGLKCNVSLWTVFRLLSLKLFCLQRIASLLWETMPCTEFITGSSNMRESSRTHTALGMRSVCGHISYQSGEPPMVPVAFCLDGISFQKYAPCLSQLNSTNNLFFCISPHIFPFAD